MRVSYLHAVRYINSFLRGANNRASELGSGSAGIVLQISTDSEMEHDIALLKLSQTSVIDQYAQAARGLSLVNADFLSRNALIIEGLNKRAEKNTHHTSADCRTIAIKVVKNSQSAETELEVSALLIKTLGVSEVLNIPELIIPPQPLSMFFSPVFPYRTIDKVKKSNISFTVHQMKAMAYQLATAIAQLGVCGIVHFDIKPDNIFVDSLQPLRVKLGDFDRCAVLQENRMQYFKPSDGTPLFMAPEVFATRNPSHEPVEIAISASIWSYGITLIDTAVSHTNHIKTLEELEHFFYTMRQDNFSIMPSNIPIEWKEFWGFACPLLQYEPTRRPNVEEILSNEWLSNWNGECECECECGNEFPLVDTLNTNVYDPSEKEH